MKPRLLPSGWWYCGCERGCKCGGTSQQLREPDLESCDTCGEAKPTEVTDHRVRPRPHPGRA